MRVRACACVCFCYACHSKHEYSRSWEMRLAYTHFIHFSAAWCFRSFNGCDFFTLDPQFSALPLGLGQIYECLRWQMKQTFSLRTKQFGFPDCFLFLIIHDDTTESEPSFFVIDFCCSLFTVCHSLFLPVRLPFHFISSQITISIYCYGTACLSVWRLFGFKNDRCMQISH